MSPHGGHLTIYEDGRAGDGLAIMHRGEITKTARECQIEPGRVTVRYGFSGRVLLGPRGHAGSVRLPINVTVTDAKRAKVTSDTVSVDTTVAVDNPIGYFSTVRTVTFDIPEGTRPGEFEVFVGFDQKAQGRRLAACSADIAAIIGVMPGVMLRLAVTARTTLAAGPSGRCRVGASRLSSACRRGRECLARPAWRPSLPTKRAT